MTGSDAAAVLAVEAAYDAAWQAGDLPRLLACLSDNAVLVSPRGDTAIGHAEIGRLLATLWEGFQGRSKHISSISRVEFVGPDVAVVDGEARVLLESDPTESPVPAHRFTDILVRRSEEWVIAHIRACYIAAPDDATR